MTNCEVCYTELTSKFCPNCGRPVEIKRIDGHYVAHELQHLLYFERGFLYTLKELLIRPGQNVREYLLENRNRLVKPIVFIIVTSLIYSLCNHYFHFEDGYVQHVDREQSTFSKIFKWVRDNYGYANIIMGIFIALWTKLFFKKEEFNIFEILILICFIMGIGMLIYSVFGIIQSFVSIDLMQIAGVLGITYMTWAIGQFYNKRKVINYVKAFFSYILGMLTFTLAIAIIAIIIDVFIKY